MKNEKVIAAVKYWLEEVVIKLNFCPFAQKVLINDKVRYKVVSESSKEEQLMCLVEEFQRLDKETKIETTLMITPVGLESFFDYLDLFEAANQLLVKLNYESVYQLASFHPDYCFDDTEQNDASNFTNRSPYPLIHIIREERLEKVLESYPDAAEIPIRNIKLANEKGTAYFEELIKLATVVK